MTFLAPTTVDLCPIKGCRQLVTKDKRCTVCGIGIGYGHVDEVPFGGGLCSGCYGLPLPRGVDIRLGGPKDEAHYRRILAVLQRLDWNVYRTAKVTGADPKQIRRVKAWGERRAS